MMNQVKIAVRSAVFLWLVFLACCGSAYGNEGQVTAGESAEPSARETIEKVVMPGEVIEGHAKYELVCKSCHLAFKKGSQAGLCLDCHKKVAEDVKQGKGFHGISKTVKDVECRKCHSEHLGRTADIVRLNRDMFDHRETDFPIRENHQTLNCVRCHKPEPKVKYRDAPSECIECHKEDEPHRGRLGKKCGDCHREATWKKYVYDHNKTKFPLLGKHEKVSCALCHPRQIWEKIPMDCYSCHRINDVHGKRYGTQCDKCHTPVEWKKPKYDHNSKESKFHLTGKHEKLKCDQCHKEGPLIRDEKDKLGHECVRCHKLDDPHKGKFDTKCDKCHSPKGWLEKIIYDHNRKDSKFPLKDKHKELKCNKCHIRPVAEQKPGTLCYDCHLLDDSHHLVFGNKCETCHAPTEWKKHKYDHNKKESKFLLKEKHEKLKCSQCHTTPVTKEQKPSIACFDCHRDHDVHKGKLEKYCDKCHTPKGWRVDVFFDHDLTSFPLIGMHGVATCENCHPDNVYITDKRKTCFDCHKEDDRHKQHLGKNCRQCHNPNGWELWNFEHDRKKFELIGAHQGLDCMLCHIKAVEKEIKQDTSCYSCHQIDDPHRGGFGLICERCHTPVSFKDIKIQR
ncbi:MAG: cytochrome c3 family protein [Proteobacteria bacterium]|nr:cytochrome c3 family protein [Pseudomonadota bacterium]MBU1737229.1 cytochrome c3 family protein [Pseudomonadota bacterium]